MEQDTKDKASREREKIEFPLTLMISDAELFVAEVETIRTFNATFKKKTLESLYDDSPPYDLNAYGRQVVTRKVIKTRRVLDVPQIDRV